MNFITKKELEFKFNKYLNYCYDNSKYQKGIFFTILIVFFVGIYILNKNTPLLVDDYGYSFGRGEFANTRISNLYQIGYSLYDHYFTWGGRVVVHFLAQVFLMFDKSVFNIFNSLAYIAMILVTYFHAVGKLKIYPMILLVINIAFYSFMPAFGQIFLWVVGSCNYLWGPLFVLLYLIPYRIQYDKPVSILKNKFLSILFFPLGVIAGWTNENLGLTLFCMIGIFIFLYWKQFKRIYIWSISGLIGSGIGATLLILAPGNFNRLDVDKLNVNIFSNFSSISKLFFKDEFLLIPLATLIILWIIVPRIKDYKLIYVYILGMFLSMYTMIGAPYFADRAKLGSLVFCLIVIGILYTYLDLLNIKLRKIILILIIVVVQITGSEFNTAKNDVVEYYDKDNIKIQHILNEKKNGNLNVIVDSNEPRSKYCVGWGLDDISTDPNYWTNAILAKYYDIETVKVEANKK